MRACSQRFLTAAIYAAVFFCGCVSVREYSQVRGQLRVEQRKALERERRLRELELLAGRLRKKATLAELERAEARSRLASAEKLLVLKPPDGARPRAEGARPESGRGVLAATIRFTAGGDRLPDAARTKIAEIAGLLAGKKGVRVLLEGHSDPAPIDRTHGRYMSNMHLSTLRALAVYHELLSHEGVDPSRVAVVGYGEHRPVPGDPKALRRVEVRLLPAEGAARAASAAGP
ncbi:MAG: OmpA/MotB family protein [Planctomycetota bacterium]